MRIRTKLTKEKRCTQYCMVMEEPKQMIGSVYCRCRCPYFQGSFLSDNHITIMCDKYDKRTATIQEILEK
jgi:hypothetical protein